MLNQLDNLTQLVGGSNRLIDQWLQDRKQLLTAFYRLVGKKTQKGKPQLLDEHALTDFYQMLVDYLSEGHFHVYDRIVADIEGQASPNLPLTQKIHPQLDKNTELLMELHDHYSEAVLEEEDYPQLHTELSLAGELLASRFVLEDKLIHFAYDVLEHKDVKDHR